MESVASLGYQPALALSLFDGLYVCRRKELIQIDYHVCSQLIELHLNRRVTNLNTSLMLNDDRPA